MITKIPLGDNLVVIIQLGYYLVMALCHKDIYTCLKVVHMLAMKDLKPYSSVAIVILEYT